MPKEVSLPVLETARGRTHTTVHKSPSQRRRPRNHLSFLIYKIATLFAAAVVATATTTKISTVNALRYRASWALIAVAPRAYLASSSRVTSGAARPFFARFRSRTQSKRTMASSAETTTRVETFPKNLRGLFGGSGVEGMSNPLMNEQILNMLPAEKKASMQDVNVLYLGTATYDIETFRDKQTARFREKGCQITSLDVARTTITADDAEKTIRSADVILVSGGNTLFAVDRWTHLGLVPHLRSAMERGCLLTGGSAGAICWFDSGHSDSADPETYLEPMVSKYGSNGEKEIDDDDEEEETSEYDPDNQKKWNYLRIPGLGFVPGPFVCCPHHDRVQSNGLLRANDFDRMLLARAKSGRKSVLGIGIDHYAAFLVEGENYKVYALPEKAGSVSKDGTAVFDVEEDGTCNGVPGVWIKRVLVGHENSTSGDSRGDDGLVVEAMLCPSEGKLKDLLEYGGDNLPGQNNMETDDNLAAVETCRKENPSGILTK